MPTCGHALRTSLKAPTRRNLMKTEIEAFKKFCRSENLKVTKERLLIFSEMISLHSHFTVDDIHFILKKKKFTVAPSSIYRFIPFLIKGKFLKSIHQEEHSTHYEHIIGHAHHDHMICQSCGNIIEFLDRDLEKLQAELASKYQFTITDHHLVLNGICQKCKANI
jgi:Fur family ferric uptake transcriptional regulator